MDDWFSFRDRNTCWNCCELASHRRGIFSALFVPSSHRKDTSVDTAEKEHTLFPVGGVYVHLSCMYTGEAEEHERRKCLSRRRRQRRLEFSSVLFSFPSLFIYLFFIDPWMFNKNLSCLYLFVPFLFSSLLFFFSFPLQKARHLKGSAPEYSFACMYSYSYFSCMWGYLVKSAASS